MLKGEENQQPLSGYQSVPHFEKGGLGGIYQDIPGFCKSAILNDIRKHDYVLTPGRYVGAAEQEQDGEPFEEKMARLTAQLNEQFGESARLESAIRKNLARLGYSTEKTI